MKSNEEKKLKGTLRPCRVKNHSEGTVATIDAVPEESFSNPEAYQHWLTVFEDLSDSEVIRTTDIPALKILCDIWGVYCRAEKDLAEEGQTITTPNGHKQPSSSFTNWKQAQIEYMKVCKEFGMTPVSRTKIITAPKKDNDALGDML